MDASGNADMTDQTYSTRVMTEVDPKTSEQMSDHWEDHQAQMSYYLSMIPQEEKTDR